MLKRLKDLSSAVLAMAALGCMGTSAVQAQEVKKQWFAFASGNQPRATEKLVQRTLKPALPPIRPMAPSAGRCGDHYPDRQDHL